MCTFKRERKKGGEGKKKKTKEEKIWKPRLSTNKPLLLPEVKNCGTWKSYRPVASTWELQLSHALPL